MRFDLLESMTEHNLPEKDDAPWLDTTYDGFMTEYDISKVLIEGDTATIMGVKYKRVEESQSFYNQLWELLETELGDTVLCDQMADRIYDLVLMSLPKEQSAAGSQNAYVECTVEGYNDCLNEIKGKLRR